MLGVHKYIQWWIPFNQYYYYKVENKIKMIMTMMIVVENRICNFIIWYDNKTKDAFARLVNR